MKPIVGIAAIGVVAFVLYNLFTNSQHSVMGCNNFCLSVHGGIGLGSY